MTPQDYKPDSQAGDERKQIKDDLIEMAIGRVRSGSTQGRHVTGVFDIPVLADYITDYAERLATEARQATLAEVYHRTPTPEMVWKTLNADRLRQEWADMNRYLEQRLGINQPGRPNNE